MPPLVHLARHALPQFIGGNHNGAGRCDLEAAGDPASEQSGGAFFTEDVEEEFRKGELLGGDGLGRESRTRTRSGEVIIHMPEDLLSGLADIKWRRD